ncbi:unnamed protein product [Calicophoron daubneyi]|uniref:F-box domain-containing protein n=1 Tax=Calicophoron daubneyi TaxID=300641 RepID=A0AAV2SXV5_CALDB
MLRSEECEQVRDRYKSSWTPLNDTKLNTQIFQERRNLLKIWFRKWSEYQRKQVLIDLLLGCNEKQLEFIEELIRGKIPIYHIDFTRILPRILSVYIFSFLDPRSLCRCAQVCWYWKYLADSNEVWAQKCARQGWYLLKDSRNFDLGEWKRHYIWNIRYLQVASPIKAAATKMAEKLEREEQRARQELEAHRERVREQWRMQQQCIAEEEERKRSDKLEKIRPWRAPDRSPNDLKRMNYFDNRTPGRSGSGSSFSQGSIPRRPASSFGVHSSPSQSRRTLIKRFAHEAPASVGRNQKHADYQLTAHCAPREPWKPTSRYPRRDTHVDVMETLRLYGKVKAFVRRNCIPLSGDNPSKLPRPQSAGRLVNLSELDQKYDGRTMRRRPRSEIGHLKITEPERLNVIPPLPVLTPQATSTLHPSVHGDSFCQRASTQQIDTFCTDALIERDSKKSPVHIEQPHHETLTDNSYTTCSTTMPETKLYEVSVKPRHPSALCALSPKATVCAPEQKWSAASPTSDVDDLFVTNVKQTVAKMELMNKMLEPQKTVPQPKPRWQTALTEAFTNLSVEAVGKFSRSEPRTSDIKNKKFTFDCSSTTYSTTMPTLKPDDSTIRQPSSGLSTLGVMPMPIASDQIIQPCRVSYQHSPSQQESGHVVPVVSIDQPIQNSPGSCRLPTSNICPSGLSVSHRKRGQAFTPSPEISSSATTGTSSSTSSSTPVDSTYVPLYYTSSEQVKLPSKQLLEEHEDFVARKDFVTVSGTEGLDGTGTPVSRQTGSEMILIDEDSGHYKSDLNLEFKTSPNHLMPPPVLVAEVARSLIDCFFENDKSLRILHPTRPEHSIRSCPALPLSTPKARTRKSIPQTFQSPEVGSDLPELSACPGEKDFVSVSAEGVDYLCTTLGDSCDVQTPSSFQSLAPETV